MTLTRVHINLFAMFEAIFNDSFLNRWLASGLAGMRFYRGRIAA
jgi:hypothetical protein